MRASALRFVAPKRVEVVEVDVDEPREGEILVRTAFSGISSGTEMLAYRGEIDPSLVLDEQLGALQGTFSFPFSYGYSCAGTVVDGALPVGTRVFCFHAHQSAFTYPAAEAIVLDDDDLRSATLFPLVETALQISLDAGAVAGVPVVVMGMGPVGLLTALLLRRAGADVIAADPVVWRRRCAAQLDIRCTHPHSLQDTVRQTRPAGRVPLVVEVSGDPQALQHALSLLDDEGTVLVGSWYGNKPATLDLGGDFHRRRLSIRSTQVSTIPAAQRARWDLQTRRDTARRLMNELPLKLLATHDWPLSRAAEAFAAIDARVEGLVHAALAYEDAGV